MSLDMEHVQGMIEHICKEQWNTHRSDEQYTQAGSDGAHMQ